MKYFLVYDSNYSVREYIGFVRAQNEDEVRQVVHALLEKNACRIASNADEYLEKWIRIEDLQEVVSRYLEGLKEAPESEVARVRALAENPTEQALEEFFCDGSNWIGDLRRALEKQIAFQEKAIQTLKTFRDKLYQNYLTLIHRTGERAISVLKAGCFSVRCIDTQSKRVITIVEETRRA